MNEELQKELLSILRSIQTGAPDAFSILIQQRAEYCSVRTTFSAFYALVGLVLIGAAAYFTKRALREECEGAQVGFVAAALSLGLTGLIVTGVNLEQIGYYYAQAKAPLGQVLGMLNK
jgi:hypothetical protein